MSPGGGPPARTRVLAWVLVVLLLPGCSSWQAVQVKEPAPPLPETGKLKIRTAEGKKVTLDHWSLDGDVLRGTHEVWIKYEPIQQPTAFQLSDISLQDGGLRGESLRSYLEARASKVVTPAPTTVAPKPLPPPPLPQKVRVRLVDRTTVELLNPSFDADSLRGVLAPDRPVAYALKDVQSVEAKHADASKTVILVLVTGAAIVGILFAKYVLELNAD